MFWIFVWCARLLFSRDCISVLFIGKRKGIMKEDRGSKTIIKMPLAVVKSKYQLMQPNRSKRVRPEAEAPLAPLPLTIAFVDICCGSDILTSVSKTGYIWFDVWFTYIFGHDQLSIFSISISLMFLPPFTILRYIMHIAYYIQIAVTESTYQTLTLYLFTDLSSSSSFLLSLASDNHCSALYYSTLCYTNFF